MKKVDCIVVGAGPAGSACAIACVRKGLDTVLIERGRIPGEKNMASFVLFTNVLGRLIPDFAHDAPLERIVTEDCFIFLGQFDVQIIQSRFYHHLHQPIAYTASRSSFDAWFAAKAEKEGATLAAGVKVDDLIMDRGRVIGVRTGSDELYADVVVGADGIHSIVAEKSGLRPVHDTTGYILGIREVLELPGDVINERFHLQPGEGSCSTGIGSYPMLDIGGGISLYTNKDSLALAIFGHLDMLYKKRINLNDRMDQLKAHPYIHSLIKDAKLREYQAHLLIDGGRVPLKSLYGNGVLLCGDAGGFMSPLYVGVSPAMLSGMVAAETIALAKKKGDFSRSTLKNYRRLMKATALPLMLKNARKQSVYLATRGRERIGGYRDAAAELMEGYVINETNFTDRPYPLLRNLYTKILRDFVPFFIRWPVDGAIFLFSKISRKTR